MLNSENNNSRKVSLNLLSKADLERIDDLSEFFYKKYNCSLLDILKGLRKSAIRIPVSIFQTDSLSCFEAIVRFLRENLNLSNKEISYLTGRKENTLSTTYKNSLNKFSGKLKEEAECFIPLSLIKDRGLSVLENISWHLKSEYNLPYNKIAKLLNRDNRTIWTVVNRAKKKMLVKK